MRQVLIASLLFAAPLCNPWGELAPAYSSEASTTEAGASEAAATATTASLDAQLLAAAREVNHAYQRKVESLVALLDSDDHATRIKGLKHIGYLHDPATTGYLLPWMQASNCSYLCIDGRRLRHCRTRFTPITQTRRFFCPCQRNEWFNARPIN
jgi:hypothetical protein